MHLSTDPRSGRLASPPAEPPTGHLANPAADAGAGRAAGPPSGRLPTGFLMHPDAALHDPGWGHPDHQGRLRALASALGRDLPALHDRVVQEEPGAAGEADLLRVHTPAHLATLRAAVERAREEGTTVALDDPDTFVSAASWDAAVGSAGAAIAGCRGVVEGRFRNAFVAARPPGHHAPADRAMGFCLFNSVAIAARWLQDQGHAERVLVVDWDVHHGNGTQAVFYRDPTVFFLSLHQSPHYPGTGAPSERGEGRGEGTTLNVELAAGTPRAEYLERFHAALDRVLGVFEPDFVLVSCGFDVMAGDPLGDQRLEVEDLHRMTREVMARADAHCGGRAVVLLEGGYDAGRTGDGAVGVLRALADVEPASIEAGAPARGFPPQGGGA